MKFVKAFAKSSITKIVFFFSILVQNEPSNRKLFGELAPGGVVGGAMDSLLQQLAYYKRHDPANPEEAELLENLFDVLCALLLHVK